MAKHTQKALNSGGRQSGSSHTARAVGKNSITGRVRGSKRTAKAVGNVYPAGRRSKGGGTSSKTRGILGQATQRYEKRNSTGRPIVR